MQKNNIFLKNATRNATRNTTRISTYNESLLFPNDYGRFYVDYQNGKPGFNTDPERGADTFCPFSASINLAISLTCYGTISSTDRGHMCNYTSKVTLYIINGLPEIQIVNVTGSSNRLYEGGSDYAYWSNAASYKITKIATIDENKNIINVLYGN